MAKINSLSTGNGSVVKNGSIANGHAEVRSNGNGNAKTGTNGLHRSSHKRPIPVTLLIRTVKYIEMHQIEIPLIIIAGIFALYPYDPTLSKSFWTLSYPASEPGFYKSGSHDVRFGFFCLLALTFLRVALMDWVFAPFALWAGIKKPRNQIRFAEQAWSFTYCSIMESIGIYLWVTSPFWTNSREFWTDYPLPHISKTVKFYYLCQSAFWFAQLFVLNVEKRRKDHWQMTTHHIVTIMLMYGSYLAGFTRVGVGIHVCMDFADILLAAAKMLNYLHLQVICDATFGLFLLSWLITRHFLFGAIIWSVIYEAHEEIPYIWDPPAGRMLTRATHTGFIVLLCSLEMLICGWFYFICQVAYRVITGKGAGDNRSSDEEEDAEAEDKKVEEQDDIVQQAESKESNGHAVKSTASDKDKTTRTKRRKAA